MIRKEVAECHRLTKELYQLTAEKTEVQDEQLARINDLLDKREAILPSIGKAVTPEEKRMGRQMMEWNKEIDDNLSVLKNQLAGKITELKHKAKNTTKYYGYNGQGSMFYDQKK